MPIPPSRSVAFLPSPIRLMTTPSVLPFSNSFARLPPRRCWRGPRHSWPVFRSRLFWRKLTKWLLAAVLISGSMRRA